MSSRLPRLPEFTAIALFALVVPAIAFAEGTGTAVVKINPDNVLTVNDKKVFPIGFTMPPPPDANAPSGKTGIEELHDAGGSFMRTGPSGQVVWDDEYLQTEQEYEDAAAKYGMLCLPWLMEL